MTLKELAYSAQRHVQASTGISLKRSHVYELLAASFGFKSFAAFAAEALLTDGGVGASSPRATPELIGRAVQLGYPQVNSRTIAQCLTDHASERGVSFVRLRDLLAALTPQPRTTATDDDSDDWEDDADDDETDSAAAIVGVEQQASRFLASSLLMDSLEHAASRRIAEAHFAMARIYRCDRPNSYLYDESLKGRTLNKVEQRWADAYIQNKPRFEKYEHHLRCAAIGGVRQAAAEFAEAFENSEFFALAERGTGPVDAMQMSRGAAAANDNESARRWLRIAGEEGSSKATEMLAQSGDQWAIRKLAESGDIEAIRAMAEMAMETDLREAWMWQHLAKFLGTDLTRSNMRAYHEGGERADEEYDDDFGGPLYVAGDEGLSLAPLDPARDREAHDLARAIFERILPHAG